MLKHAILATFAYSNIFAYPLTVDEIYKWLISDSKVDRKQIQQTLPRLKEVGRDEKYYFLKGRANIIKSRNNKEKIAGEKIQEIWPILMNLKFIPFVKLIGLSGGLAIGIADPSDDVDLLVITQKQRVWLTRLFLIFFFELRRKRRRPKQTRTAGKVCLNMFMSEESLTLPPYERDVYGAHEIIYMKTVWDKDNVYSRFRQANSWTDKYLANSSIYQKPENIKQKKNILFLIFSTFLDMLDLIAYALQLIYMYPKKTNEVVTRSYVRFHPRDRRDEILKTYNQALGRTPK